MALPVQYQAIIGTNEDPLFFPSLGKNFSEIWIKRQQNVLQWN